MEFSIFTVKWGTLHILHNSTDQLHRFSLVLFAAYLVLQSQSECQPSLTPGGPWLGPAQVGWVLDMKLACMSLSIYFAYMTTRDLPLSAPTHMTLLAGIMPHQMQTSQPGLPLPSFPTPNFCIVILWSCAFCIGTEKQYVAKRMRMYPWVGTDTG